MKKFTILLFGLMCFFFSTKVIAQKETSLPQRKYAGGYRLKQYFNDPRDYMQGNSISFGYSKSTFLSPSSGSLIEKGDLKSIGGLHSNYRYVLYPLIIDLSAFKSVFESNSIKPTYGDTCRIQHNGLEFYLSTAIFPTKYRTSEFIVPYVGIGYQSSALALYSSKAFFTKEENLISAAKTSGMAYKIGLMINFGQVIFLNTEYKRTLSLANEYSFSNFSISIGYRVVRDN